MFFFIKSITELVIIMPGVLSIFLEITYIGKKPSFLSYLEKRSRFLEALLCETQSNTAALLNMLCMV